MNYQQQAEQEMWDAASHHYEERSYRYQVQAPDTGAICMNTNSLEEARTRADLVGGIVLENGLEIDTDPAEHLGPNLSNYNQHGPARPDYDPYTDHPERYSRGRI